MNKLIISILALFSLESVAQNRISKVEREVENVDEVRVEGSFVDLYVNTGDRVYFKGEIIGNGDEGDYRFETDIVGSTLVIRVTRIANRNRQNYKMSKSRIDLTITDGVKLDIDNSSGDVYVANLCATDSKIKVTSGDIDLKSIISNLKVKTSSGDIKIDRLTGDSEIESTSGDQKLYNIRGDIKIRASSGDITVSEFNGKIDVQATSGDIEIRKGVGAIKAHTSSGDIDGYEIELNEKSYFEATSGDIEIDFVNNLSDLSFDLTTTSGDLEVGNKSRKKSLIIDRDGIKVIGKTSSGDQEYD